LAINGNPTKKRQCYTANSFYSTVKKLSFGAVLKHAEREVESGNDGDMERLQFSVKYAF